MKLFNITANFHTMKLISYKPIINNSLFIANAEYKHKFPVLINKNLYTCLFECIISYSLKSIKLCKVRLRRQANFRTSTGRLRVKG